MARPAPLVGTRARVSERNILVFSCQSEIYPVCLQYLLSRMCFGGRSLLLPELGTHGMRGSNTGRVQRTSEQRAHSIGSAKFIFLG